MRQIKRLTVPAYGLAKKLDPERRQLLAICGEFHAFSKGEIIMREGEIHSGLYLVLNGVLSPRRQINEHSFMQLSSIKRGQSFGEVNLFHPIGARATIIAMTDGELWKIEKVQLDAMISDDLVIAREVLSWLCGQMARRLRRADQRYMDTKEEYDLLYQESLSDDDEEAVEAEGDEPVSEASEPVQEVAVDEAAPERALT